MRDCSQEGGNKNSTSILLSGMKYFSLKYSNFHLQYLLIKINILKKAFEWVQREIFEILKYQINKSFEINKLLLLV